MDRAQGATQGFLPQNLHGTHTSSAESSGRRYVAAALLGEAMVRVTTWCRYASSQSRTDGNLRELAANLCEPSVRTSRTIRELSYMVIVNVREPREPPANLREPSANLRELARTIPHPRTARELARTCANLREPSANFREPSANHPRTCANLRELSENLGVNLWELT